MDLNPNVIDDFFYPPFEIFFSFRFSSTLKILKRGKLNTCISPALLENIQRDIFTSYMIQQNEVNINDIRY